MKGRHTWLFCCMALLPMLSCEQPDRPLIERAWHLDSMYTFYDGIGFWGHQEDDGSVDYTFSRNGMMWAKHGRQPFSYLLSNDSLFWGPSVDELKYQVEVMALQEDAMVWRKHLPTYRSEAGEHFLIQVFSPIEE
ncbi:hypothetical protein [Phaeodactylibacter luteus]|uniref:Uncharacterized protein n=1 Tax=Phaeodactylibacter luteus TaxID=1564516 RepID=A0A5C6RG54_9BACT|nr:hypothetical protein [Phaeodactylibacter luteus]TXB61316.1 hypothetical protein FRY97_19720 [Phaeodactylibacter luteus]